MKSNEDEEHITTYKEAMATIKEATGVSDVHEVVRRFMSQGDTKAHLERLKEENNQQLRELREEKVRGQTCRQTQRQTDRHTYIHTYRQTDRQI